MMTGWQLRDRSSGSGSRPWKDSRVQIGTNGDFKMFSAVKWVGNEGAIISTRKITGLRIMRPALWA